MFTGVSDGFTHLPRVPISLGALGQHFEGPYKPIRVQVPISGYSGLKVPRLQGPEHGLYCMDIWALRQKRQPHYVKPRTAHHNVLTKPSTYLARVLLGRPPMSLAGCLLIPLANLTLFHCYLIATNTTTNEVGPMQGELISHNSGWGHAGSLKYMECLLLGCYLV